MSEREGELVNYIATHVRYRDDRPLVEGLRLLVRAEDDFEDRGLVERDEVIDILEGDERIFTWDYDGDGLGAEVLIEYVDVGEKFLRVDEQEVAEDDLGELPPPE